MKITIIQGAFFPVPPIKGGAVEKIWYKLGIEFAKLGNDVIHISKLDPTLLRNEFSHNVKYVRVKGFLTPSNPFILKLYDFIYTLRAIQKVPEDTDVIVTNTFFAPILLKKKLKQKVIVSVERKPRGQMKYYLRSSYLRACSNMISNNIKREIDNEYHSKVLTIPNPIPFNLTPNLNQTKENIILYTGRIHPEKGIETLINAFKILRQPLSTWRLLIIGPFKTSEGGGGEIYINHLRSLAEKSDIQFIAPIYDETELISYYTRAKIFCYPIQDCSGDAAPVSPREAMACGCVPVVSAHPSLEDLVTHNINGLKFNQSDVNQHLLLADNLQEIIDDNNLFITVSEEAIKTAAKYTIESISYDFIDIFNKTINDKNS